MNMKKAKPEDRIDYWRFHVAAHSFDQARAVGGKLNGLTDSDPLFLPLILALHVLYARPFKHDKASRRVEESLVPQDFTSGHKMLLRMRDRIFAHHDKEAGIKDSDTDIDLFQLVVDVRGGEMRPGVQLVYPTEFQRQRVQQLCDHLYRVCMAKAQEALSKCLARIPSDALYRVSTEFEGRAPLLIRSEWSTEQSRGHLKETIRRQIQ